MPDYWIPFLPVAVAGGPLRMRRGKLPTAATGPLGRLLGYPGLDYVPGRAATRGRAPPAQLPSRARTRRLDLCLDRPPALYGRAKAAAGCGSTIWSIDPAPCRNSNLAIAAIDSFGPPMPAKAFDIG